MLIILIISQIVLHLISYTTAQPNIISRICQDTFGNYTPNSAFKNNLDTFFHTISSDTKIDYGFYNISMGKNLDTTVNGIGLCRPDLSAATCRDCLNKLASALIFSCPNQKDAIGFSFFVRCMIRYSIRYIFKKMELSPWYRLHKPIESDIDKVKYNQTVSSLLATLQVKAAFGDSRRKFAAGNASVTSSFTMYALVQCTPDLETSDCYACLDSAISYALITYYGEQVTVVYPSCNIRYENSLFYDSMSLFLLNPSTSPPPPLISTQPLLSEMTKGKVSKNLRLVIEIFLPIIVSLLLLASLLRWFFQWKRSKLQKIQSQNPESLQMSFDTIRAATGSFSIANKLGQGGFGIVYKGTLINGQAIAVKRLSRKSGQGEEEFKNEAALVARLQHRNLVKFLGYCLEGEERLLIYELLPNKSLDYILFDPIKRVQLDWQTRFKIIRGIARGLLYLHEDSRLLVVHRDLKSGNILLDANLNPKISDFGMAKLFGVDQAQGNASKICGTYGYMPPEYVQQGHFSFKSDVYSFGVLLLEIITGLRVGGFYNVETGENLLSFAWRNWLEGTPLNIVDSKMAVFNNIEVLRCINIGLLCVQENISHRPIMSSVVLMLNSHHTIDLTVPSRPAFLLDKDGVNSDQSSSKVPLPHDTRAFNESANEVSISELEAR